MVLAAPVLASCTSVEIEDHSLQFNQATGSLGNRLLLLNTIRAAKGYPLQFSKVTNYQGQSRLDGGLSLNLPFINTIGRAGTASPTATIKSGVQNLQLTDLNTAEIQKALRTQVKANDFAYYRSQGWPKALVNTILVESVYVDPTLLAALTDASTRACRDPGRSEKRRRECQWLQSQKAEPCRERRASPDGDTVLVYENDPRRYCEYVSFQRFFASIRVLQAVSLDLNPRADPNECKTTWIHPKDPDTLKKDGKGAKDKAKGGGDGSKGMSETVKEGKVSVDVNVKIAEKSDKDKDDDSSDRSKDGTIGLNIPRDLNITPKALREGNGKNNSVLEAHKEQLQGLGNLRNEYLCLLKEGKTPINIIWRSPERMVRYLGDVVAVQTLGSGQNIQILNEDGYLVDLFRVERGRDVFGRNAAVSVEGPERESFFIPLPDQDSKLAHLSLQAMALVMESFNQAVSGKALPQPATLFLSGG